MQEWLFILPALVILVFVVLVFRRLPWSRARWIRHESRWTGTTSIGFAPPPFQPRRPRDEGRQLGEPRPAAPELPAVHERARPSGLARPTGPALAAAAELPIAVRLRAREERAHERGAPDAPNERQAGAAPRATARAYGPARDREWPPHT